MRKRNPAVVGLLIVLAAGVGFAALLNQGCGSDSFTCTYCLNGSFYDCSISEVACALAQDTSDPSLCIRVPSRDGECNLL